MLSMGYEKRKVSDLKEGDCFFHEVDKEDKNYEILYIFKAVINPSKINYKNLLFAYNLATKKSIFLYTFSSLRYYRFDSKNSIYISRY